MKRSVCGVCLVLAAVSAFAEAQSFSKLARLTLTADADYAVATERDADFDIEAQPVFWLDCSQREGWVFHATVANRVMKVPNLMGGDRYLTGDKQEVQQENYWSWYTDKQGKPAHYGMWYSGWNSITGPTLRESDGVIKGPYLDCGAPDSKHCLFFNPIVPAGETTETCVASNILRNVGTVVGVYKPWTDGGEGRGGQFFGGKDFNGHSGYSATTYGTNLFESVFSSSAKAAASGNTLWHNLQRNDAGTTYWTPKWEVVAFNPTAANLTADGVGCGDPSGVDYARTSGGQCVAELIVFDQVLSEEDLKKVIKHLMVKWLPEAADGIDGKARVSSVLLRNSGEGLAAGHVATFDVPEGEALAIDGVRGGAGTTAQKIVKTGAGPLTVNDAKNFGGEIDLEAGTLAFAARKVPTFDELPAGMSFNLDASDTSTMLVEDGCVAAWTNLLKNSRNLSLYNNTVARRPRFIPNALGEGMNVVDFGSRTDGDWAYLAWRVPPKLGTVLIVTDARIQGGGTPFDGNLQRGNSTHWWLSRNSSYKTKILNGDDMRAIANVWMNGRWNDNTVDAYETPSWQVAAFRAPPNESQPYYLGARYISSNNNEAGGLRLGEVIAYQRTLDEQEVRDVNAYLMKKWFGRIAPGYADPSDVADYQTVVAAADAMIDVPGGETLRVGRLETTGAAVKTGEGTLVIGPDSDLTGGLTIGGGKVVTGASDVSETCEMAKEPYLHLDATDLNSMFTFVSGETTYVAAWQDRTGRAGAWSDNSGASRLPFLNTEDGLNGLPVVDFGEQVNSYSTTAGRYLLTEPQVENARALYVIYAPNVSADGSAGGQIFGHQNAGGNVYDLSRGSSSPTLDQPFFKNCSEYIKAGEVYTNGERIASASVNTFKPTGGWQLVELHPTRGLRFDALATGSSFRYLYGGLRLGEVIVYERPLSAREKVATRNYLLKKWFPEQTREELPPKPAAAAITGSISFGAGASWGIAVKADGKTDDRMAVTGTISFGTGATISLTGLTAFTAEQLQNLKLVIANAGAYEGLEGVTVTGDVAFTTDTLPRLVAKTNGDLVIRFGRKGLLIIVRGNETAGPVPVRNRLVEDFDYSLSPWQTKADEWRGTTRPTLASVDCGGYDRLAFEVVNFAAGGDQLHVYLDGETKQAGLVRVLTPFYGARTYEIPLSEFETAGADLAHITAVRFAARWASALDARIRNVRLLRAGETADDPVLDATMNARLAESRSLWDADRAGIHRTAFQSWRTACVAAGTVADGAVFGKASPMAMVRPRDDFDAEPATDLGVRLARNEKESLQFLVAPDGADLSDVAVAVEMDGGFDSDNIEVSPMGYSELKRIPAYSARMRPDESAVRKYEMTPIVPGWFPDPILAFLKKVDVKGDDVQGFWIKVSCPENQAAGTFTGTLKASWSVNGVAKSWARPFSVRVNDFTIGRTAPIPVSLSFRPSITRDSWDRLGRRVGTDADPDRNAWRHEYFIEKNPGCAAALARARTHDWAMFLADNLVTISCLYSAGDVQWDELVNLKDEGRLGFFQLRYWQPTATPDKWVSTTRERYERAQELGILDHAIFYGSDELTSAQFDGIEAMTGLIKREFPGPLLVTTAKDKTYSVVSQLKSMDVFVPVTGNYVHENAVAARAVGKKVGWYVCGGADEPGPEFFFGRDAIEPRLLTSAAAAKYGCEWFLYYAIASWSNIDPIGEGTGPFTSWSPEGWGNFPGDGSVVCCGPGGMPLSTQRFENFRDGLEDLWYAKIYREKFGCDPEVPESVVRSVQDQTHDPAVLQAWRDNLADLIEAKDGN